MSELGLVNFSAEYVNIEGSLSVHQVLKHVSHIVILHHRVIIQILLGRVELHRRRDIETKVLRLLIGVHLRQIVSSTKTAFLDAILKLLLL